jgi:hypothetical protein
MPQHLQMRARLRTNSFQNSFYLISAICTFPVLTSDSTDDMAEPLRNPLISSKPSDSGLTVSLHPLVLLTVSDQVTRQAVRKQKGPVAGALLGQQKGREITAEHAFPVALVRGSEGRWQFNYDWMETRIQQCEFVDAVYGAT